MPISESSPLLGHSEHHHVDHDTPSSPCIRPGNKADQPCHPTRCSTASHDEEQQRVETTRNYEGIPDLQKRMKYIFPALAVGVINEPSPRCDLDIETGTLTRSSQVFLASGDQTITVSSYGTIGSELKALNSTSWIATAYLLTVTSFQPLYGKLSDIFGRKQALLFAYAIFGVGALLCGLARTMNELIAARVSRDILAHRRLHTDLVLRSGSGWYRWRRHDDGRVDPALRHRPATQSWHLARLHQHCLGHGRRHRRAARRPARRLGWLEMVGMPCLVRRPRL